MKNRKTLLALLIFLSVITYAQTKTISGIALDRGGDPIPGCNFFVKGTTNATVTNICGEFELMTKGNEVTVIFSCLTSDLRAFETIVNTSEFNEGDRIIFRLRGHGKMKNKDCKKRIEKRLKKYTID